MNNKNEFYSMLNMICFLDQKSEEQVLIHLLEKYKNYNINIYNKELKKYFEPYDDPDYKLGIDLVQDFMEKGYLDLITQEKYKNLLIKNYNSYNHY